MSEDRQLSQVTSFQDVVSTQGNTVKWKLHNSQVVSFSTCTKTKSIFSSFLRYHEFGRKERENG